MAGKGRPKTTRKTIIFPLRLDEVDKARLERLKKFYGFRETAPLIRFLITKEYRKLFAKPGELEEEVEEETE